MAIFTQWGGGVWGWRFSHQTTKMGPRNCLLQLLLQHFFGPCRLNIRGENEAIFQKHRSIEKNKFPMFVLLQFNQGVGLSIDCDWFSKEIVFYTYNFGFKASHICWPYTVHERREWFLKMFKPPLGLEHEECQHPALFTRNGETIRGIL